MQSKLNTAYSLVSSSLSLSDIPKDFLDQDEELSALVKQQTYVLSEIRSLIASVDEYLESQPL